MEADGRGGAHENSRLFKTIAETLNEGTEIEPMLLGVLPKLLDVMGFTTGWIFLAGPWEALLQARRGSRPSARPLPGREAPDERGRVLVPQRLLERRAGAGRQHHGVQAAGRR